MAMHGLFHIRDQLIMLPVLYINTSPSCHRNREYYYCFDRVLKHAVISPKKEKKSDQMKLQK